MKTQTKTDGKTSPKIWNCGHTEDEHSFADTMFCVRGLTCYNCGEKINESEIKRWYHADQDDLVCLECAKKLKHTDTIYAGLCVYDGIAIKLERIT